MEAKKQRTSFGELLKAIFIIAFFIVLPLQTHAYCHKGATIYQSYNEAVKQSVWTMGIGSSDPNSIQGYRSLQDAMGYIDDIGILGYKYNQCSSYISPSYPSYPSQPSYQTPSVNTISANPTYSDVTLQGYVSSLGGASSAQVSFEIWQKQTGSSAASLITANKTVYSPGYFTITTNYPQTDATLFGYRARIQTNAGTGYGYEQTFTRPIYVQPTPPVYPTYPQNPTITYPQVITSNASYNSYSNIADFSGYLSNLGNDNSAKTGFCLYEKNYGFYCQQELISEYNKYYAGSFTYSNFSTASLKSGTQYCVRAFAQNSYAKQFASEYQDKCFTTKSSYTPPTTVYTYPETRTENIYYNSTNDEISLYGYLASAGNYGYAKTGFCIYEKNYGFSCVSELTANAFQSSLGNFSYLNYSTQNLKRNTQYCVRAYGENEYGKKYSLAYYDKCFTTRYDYYQPPYNPGTPSTYLPQVRTMNAIYYPNTLIANFSGYVDYIGSYMTAKVGFCLYRYESGFSCEQELISEYSRRYNGYFYYNNFPRNGLLSDTKYCVRAYGENSAGRYYASEYQDKCFTTDQGSIPSQNEAIEISKTATAGTECQTADIQIRINCKSSYCQNVVVYDALAANTNYISNSASPIVSYYWPHKGQASRLLVWSIGNMNNGTRTIQYKIKFADGSTNQLTNDYPESKVTYNFSGAPATKIFEKVFVNPISCSAYNPDPGQQDPGQNPDPQPQKKSCQDYENIFKDKFQYCGEKGYYSVCVNSDRDFYTGCSFSELQCTRLNSKNISCQIPDDYRQYKIQTIGLYYQTLSSFLARGYLFSGYGKADVGFIIYEQDKQDQAKEIQANQAQANGYFQKTIAANDLGDPGKTYCIKAFYMKGSQKVLAQEEKCYTQGGCYKGIIIYSRQGVSSMPFWARLPEYYQKQNYSELQSLIDEKINSGKTFSQCQ